MENIFETPNFGTVTVRNAMFDIDGTTLEEGIEIKGDDVELIEIYGYRDVEEMSVEDVETLIENNQ